jgi:hypothetical protein
MNSPYTVLIDGVPVQCDTPEAALALAKAHASGTGSTTTQTTQRSQGGESNGSCWTDQRIANFFKNIEGKGKQRRLLETLLETEDSRTDDQLLQALGLTNGMELAGVFAGLYKNAKKVGADPRELYIKRPVTIGDKRGFEYTLHEGFRKIAARLGPK